MPRGRVSGTREGPFFYGGHNRDGIPVAQGLYDGHGAGLGATPTRDGVHCGGNMNIPSGGISDVERIEMQYPFLYFTRNLYLDGGGAGKFNGGTGSFRIYMIYGSQDCSVSYRPYSRLPEGVGLFGGNPAGIGESVRFIKLPALHLWNACRAVNIPSNRIKSRGIAGESSPTQPK